MVDLWQARRRFFLRCALFAWVVVFGSIHTLEVAAPDRPGSVAADTRRQIRWLERSLSDGDARLAQRYFPEGELFTYEFYGLALENVAETTKDPRDVERAVREVRRLLPKIDGLLHHAPFGQMAQWDVRGGICWFAGQNLLRARLVRLAGGATAEEVERLHADSAVLARAFAQSESGVLEAYPGQSWPVDSLFGYRSLQIHDELYGTRYFATFARYERTMRRSADPKSGLMPSFVYLDGRARDVPRGCALSWSLAVLPDLDPDFAAEQWAAYRHDFLRCAGGLCLLREYPPGVDRASDVDSGPVVAGLGMSASAFGLAAARAQGDTEVAEALRRTGELLGFPAVSWWGKRYLGGSIALFDVFAVWTRTVPMPASAPAGGVHVVALIPAAMWIALACWAFRAARRSRGALDRARAGSRHEAVLFGVSVAACLFHVAWPSFHLLFLYLFLCLVEGLAAFGRALAPSPEPALEGANG
jgi:hypothetical protein